MTKTMNESPITRYSPRDIRYASYELSGCAGHDCPIAGRISADGDYCGHEQHSRVQEIQRLAEQQIADDRSTIQHATDGRTSTARVGSAWVQSLPADGGGIENELLWPEWDLMQERIHQHIDRFIAGLAPEEAELILLRFQDRAPLRSIGNTVGASKDTVSRMLAEVLAKLRQVVQDETGSKTYEEVRAALLDEALKGGAA